MHELIATWRAEAATLDRSCREPEMWCLNRCANELERTWHDEQHGAFWRDNCGVCKEERLGHDR